MGQRTQEDWHEFGGDRRLCMRCRLKNERNGENPDSRMLTTDALERTPVHRHRTLQKLMTVTEQKYDKKRTF
jgi:hypothetical protein